MIYYSQEYHDDRGATIIQNHIEEGLPPADFPLFIGVGAIQIPTPMGIMEEKILVPIKATDLKDAFAKFEDTMKTDGPKEAEKTINHIKTKIAEMQSKNGSRIVMANQMPPIQPQGFQRQ